LRTLITRNKFFAFSISMLALIGIFSLSGCSQKASSEEIAKQVKIAMEEAEKNKQESATAAKSAPATADAQVAVTAKHVSKAKVVEKTGHMEEAKSVQVATAEKVVCSNCGVVLSVNELEVKGEGSGLGAVAGGVAGGLLGNQIGNGNGRDVATIVGVFGGVIAGNEIEKNTKKSKVYEVSVKMANGTERVLRHNTNPKVSAGDKVKVEDDLVIKI
jgi:outer membrane lipoprotein SlyB